MAERSKKPWAALLAGVLIAVSEVAFVAKTENLTGLPFFQPTADDATIVAKRSLLPSAAGKVVLVGDSSCMMGLNPLVMRENNVDATNLGTLSSLTLEGFACLAEDALEAEPAPKALVLVILPRAFEVTEARAREFELLPRYLVAYDKESEQLPTTLRDRWRTFTRKHAFNVFPPEFLGNFASFENALREKLGHWPEGKTYRGVKEPASKFEATDFARRALHRLTAAARIKKVALYLWISPAPSDAVTAEYVDNVNAFLAELKNAEPDLKQMHEKMPLLPPDRFGTVTHLNPEAAKVQSREFALKFAEMR